MKSKLVIFLVVIMIVSTTLLGCSAKEKVDNALISNTEEKVEISGDIKEQAKKEGISVREMQKILEGLTELGAEKYGISKEELIRQIEANGDTILSEWQVASKHMGITIKELYEYEKVRVNSMTDEQKRTMHGMDQALKKLEGELNIPDIGTTDIENMLGIEKNTTGELRVVTMSDGELKEALAYKIYEITQDYTDEDSVIFEYTSSADINKLREYYKNLILNTEGYTRIGTPDGISVIYQGLINKTVIYIEVDGSREGMTTVKTCLDLYTKK